MFFRKFIFHFCRNFFYSQPTYRLRTDFQIQSYPLPRILPSHVQTTNIVSHTLSPPLSPTAGLECRIKKYSYRLRGFRLCCQSMLRLNIQISYFKLKFHGPCVIYTTIIRKQYCNQRTILTLI